MEGWIKLHRKILKTNIWQDKNLARVFFYCLLRANHEEKNVFFNSQVIQLQPGQFITSIKKMSKEIGLSTQKIRNKLINNQKSQKITIKTTNRYTLISVVNWTKYQNDNKQNNKQKLAKTTSVSTTDKNIRNNKKENIKEKRKYKIENYLNSLQLSKFKNKESWLKYKLTSPSNFERILVCFYIFQGFSFDNNFELVGLLQKDIRNYTRYLLVISKQNDDKWLKIMRNLKKNNRLSIKAICDAIKHNSTISANLSKELSERLSIPF